MLIVKIQDKIDSRMLMGNNGKIRRVKVLLGLRDGSSVLWLERYIR